MGGAHISNGAVVAANSVVNSFVPPYAIVGGTPAKVIGYRFSELIIEKFQEVQWWHWTDELLKKNESFFSADVNIEMFDSIQR